MNDARFPWFRCYPGKWLGALAEMPPDQGYVYVVVCMRIYEKRGPVPDSIEALARRTGFRPSHVARIIDKLCSLGKLIKLPCGDLTNPFAEREIADGEKISSTTAKIRSNAAKIRWEKHKQNQKNGYAKAMQTDADLDLDIEEDKKERKKEPALALTGGASSPPDDWPRNAFDVFWEPYPNKVGKEAAHKALDQVRKKRLVTWAALTLGLSRYIAKTDDRPWCNPATWLHQGRWDDEPAPPPAHRNGGAPRTEYQRQSDETGEYLRSIRERGHERENGELRGADDGPVSKRIGS